MLRRAAISIPILFLLGAAPPVAPAHHDLPVETIEACLLRGGDVASVMAACTALIASEKADHAILGPALIMRARAYSVSQQYDAALADYQTAIKADPKLWRAYYERGELLIRLRRHTEAVAVLTQAIKLRPDLGAAYRLRANALDYIGEPNAALADYNAAVRLAPDAASFDDRAVNHMARGQNGLALADYDRAIRRDPRGAYSYYRRGQFHFALGQFAAAVGDLETAVRIDPKDAYKALWLYLAWARDGKTSTAELARAAEHLNLIKWPGPIIRVFIGNLPEGELKPAPDPIPWITTGNLCEMQFYLGERALIAGNRTEASARFKAAIATGITEYTEYRMAQIELKRLGSAPAQR